MNKQKYIEALEAVCENANGCSNCLIAKSKYGASYCVRHKFEDMSEENLILYAEIAGVNISDDNSTEDIVNHASHYNDGAIECIDAIAASMTPTEYAGFLKGQVLKYVWRYRLKGKPVEDLKKAGYYLDRLIQITERGEVKEND